MKTTSLILAILLLSAHTADAASLKKRSDYSKAQQAQFFKKALAECRKKFGDRLHHVQMNYTQSRFYCYHY